jgi:hypothetical protein
MKPLQVYRLLLSVAIEYVAGYEFPVWVKGNWKRGGQWKLDYLLASKSESP